MTRTRCKRHIEEDEKKKKKKTPDTPTKQDTCSRSSGGAAPNVLIYIPLNLKAECEAQFGFVRPLLDIKHQTFRRRVS